MGCKKYQAIQKKREKSQIMKNKWNTKNQLINPKEVEITYREKEHRSGRTNKNRIVRWQI